MQHKRHQSIPALEAQVTGQGSDVVKQGFSKATLHELYGRLVLNILCGNTDDHARNHAAFWDGERLTLTPAYDICPQNRSGNTASQAMPIVGDKRLSTLANCLEAAPHLQLDAHAAKEIIAKQIGTLRSAWNHMAEETGLTEVERKLFGQHLFLNPFIFEGSPAGLR